MKAVSIKSFTKSTVKSFLPVSALIVLISGNVLAATHTHLKRILLLDKSLFGANGHKECREDLRAALERLALQHRFDITVIGQNDNTISTYFNPDSLSQFQVVLFSNNDGVDKQVTGNARTHFENYVENGGGFIPIHAASAFTEGWTWFDQALIQKFYGAFGSNHPSAELIHDLEGMEPGTETAGIFIGLSAPKQFSDEFYSFQRSPRGTENTTILVTLDESSSTKPIEGPMGEDHPLVWAKRVGAGRVLHISLGHSWYFLNVYTQGDAYLTKLLYGSLRYAAGDFIGCTDPAFVEFNPDATKSQPADCKTVSPVRITASHSSSIGNVSVQYGGAKTISVKIASPGPHQISILSPAGKVLDSRHGVGPSDHSFSSVSQSGMVLVAVRIGGETIMKRVFSL